MCTGSRNAEVGIRDINDCITVMVIFYPLSPNH